MGNRVEEKDGSSAYEYFDALRGQELSKLIYPEEGRGSVHVRKYRPGEGVNIQNELLVIIKRPRSSLIALLYPSGEVTWRRGRDGEFINLSERKARLAGDLLVRCAEAIAS